MKKAIILAAFLSLYFAGNSQQVTKDKDGNYIVVKAATIDDKAKETGKTFTAANGSVYPVFISKNGKLFIIRTSKTGNQYNQYLKVN